MTLLSRQRGLCRLPRRWHPRPVPIAATGLAGPPPTRSDQPA